MLFSKRSLINLQHKWLQCEKKLKVIFSVFNKPKKFSSAVVLVVAVFVILFIFTQLNQYKKDRGFLFACPDDYSYIVKYVRKNFETQKVEKIPNVVHFYRNHREAYILSRSELTNIEAALNFHEYVYLHTENLEATQKALSDADFNHKSLNILSAPTSSHLPPLISILWNHGGIFLHNDIFLLRGLNDLRYYDKVKSKDGSIVAANKYAVRIEWSSESTWKTEDIVFKNDWGALYIPEALRNCSIKAVRLGDDTRTRLSWIQDQIK